MKSSKDYDFKKLPIGLLIKDGNRKGIIYREIKSGTWTDQPLFNWRVNYEIYYDDETVCVIGAEALKRLVESGRVEIIGEKK